MTPVNGIDCSAAALGLTEAGREFHRRGWVRATSGNFSAKLSGDPLRLLVTRKGADKGSLTDRDFLIVDRTGALISGTCCPSAETGIHLAVMRATGAGAVLHVPSVHASSAAEHLARATGTELHRKWLPVFEDNHDYLALSREIESRLMRYTGCHGLLLKAHGLYVWGADIAQARKHVEGLESFAELLSEPKASLPYAKRLK